jgi:hypothetical protein
MAHGTTILLNFLKIILHRCRHKDSTRSTILTVLICHGLLYGTDQILSFLSVPWMIPLDPTAYINPRHLMKLQNDFCFLWTRTTLFLWWIKRFKRRNFRPICPCPMWLSKIKICRIYIVILMGMKVCFWVWKENINRQILKRKFVGWKEDIHRGFLRQNLLDRMFWRKETRSNRRKSYNEELNNLYFLPNIFGFTT